MKELIFTVEVGYRTFKFDVPKEAMEFAMCAKEHESEDTNVEIHIYEKKDETQE